MEVSAEYREAYDAYLAEVEACVTTDRVPTVLDYLIEDGLHYPLFSTVLFNPAGPTVQTVSVLASGNKETHDLVIRRDLNPFAEPYQVPIGILDMPFGKRLVASLDVVEEHLRAAKCGPRLWDRANDDFVRALGAIARKESIPDGPNPETALRWSSFLSWWSLVSSAEMATAAIAETPRAWAGAILNSGLEPEVDLETAARWIGPFCATYEQAAARKESENPLPIEQICRRYPTSQIRPCMSGWEVADTEHGPEVHPLARGAQASQTHE